ncbi:MAG: hypothetical protein ABSD58_14255 [Verrucomicrobiia bacterium]|jgi:hypothetical protein
MNRNIHVANDLLPITGSLVAGPQYSFLYAFPTRSSFSTVLKTYFSPVSISFIDVFAFLVCVRVPDIGLQGFWPKPAVRVA